MAQQKCSAQMDGAKEKMSFYIHYTKNKRDEEEEYV
jgi:hypothetical protein